MSNINRVLIAIDDETAEEIVIQKGLLLAHQHNAEVMICAVINNKKVAKTFADIIP